MFPRKGIHEFADDNKTIFNLAAVREGMGQKQSRAWDPRIFVRVWKTGFAV